MKLLYSSSNGDRWLLIEDAGRSYVRHEPNQSSGGMGSDTDVDELKVGLPLRMVYRVKDFDPLRGFRRYFWKATPQRGGH